MGKRGHGRNVKIHVDKEEGRRDMRKRERERERERDGKKKREGKWEREREKDVLGLEKRSMASCLSMPLTLPSILS